MKIRNPKSEIRKKPEARRPKLEGLKSGFSIQNDYVLAETIQSGGDEINATPINREQATQRREGAKRVKPDQFCSLNSNHGRPAREPFFLCVFAVLSRNIVTYYEELAGVRPSPGAAAFSQPGGAG
jgi:hypothetical protein